jgi:predicted metal-dependent hydrolase
MDSITVDNITFPVKIYFEERKTFRVSIGKKAINIRIPKFLPKYRQNEQINKMLKWAQERIKKDPVSFKPQKPKSYRNGDKIKIFNNVYELSITYKSKKTGSSKICGNKLLLSLPEKLKTDQLQKIIPQLIGKAVGKEYQPALEALINDLNNRFFKKKIGKIKFKNNKSNWGSCSGKNNININTRLLLAPMSVLLYVCIHELAHLTVRNHSRKFWSIVKRVMPGYKEVQFWLKKNRNSLRF